MFSFLGRILAGLSVFGFLICAAFTFNDPNSIGLNIFCIFLSILIGLVEMPLVCSCFRWCECVARYMKYVTGWWWVRGVIYIGLTAAAYAIYATQHVQNIYMVIVLAALDLSGLLFFVAMVRREPNPAYELMFAGKKGGAGATAGGSGSAGSSGRGGFLGFGRKKAETVAASAGAAAGSAAGTAAAKSMGQQLFGPKDEESAASAPASAPAVAASPFEKESSKASMFSGGGLFGSGKYGYAADHPEANPFVS